MKADFFLVIEGSTVREQKRVVHGSCKIRLLLHLIRDSYVCFHMRLDINLQDAFKEFSVTVKGPKTRFSDSVSMICKLHQVEGVCNLQSQGIFRACQKS